MDVGHLPRYADLVVVEIGEVLFAVFGKASSEQIVGVGPNIGVAGGLFDFGADELVFQIVGRRLGRGHLKNRNCMHTVHTLCSA